MSGNFSNNKKHLSKTGEPLYIISATPNGVSVSNCKKCKICCWASYEDVDIPLQEHETRLPNLTKVSKYQAIIPYGKKSCTALGKQGCKLSDSAPLACKIYPFNLMGNEVVIDVGCPAVKFHTLTELDELSAHVSSLLSACSTDYLYRLSTGASLDPNRYLYTGVIVSKE